MYLLDKNTLNKMETPMKQWVQRVKSHDLVLSPELQAMSEEITKLEEKIMKDVFDYGIITGLRISQGKTVKYPTADEYFNGEFKD